MPTVSELLLVRKTVVLPLRVRPKPNPAHRAWELELHSPASAEFAVFFRVNLHLPESFSIGLTCRDPGGGLHVLLRVNGDHGGHQNPDGYRVEGAHMHLPSSSALESPLPIDPWRAGPRCAVPLFVSVLRLSEGWRMLATSTNIEVTPNVQRLVDRATAKLEGGIPEQLDLFADD